MDPATASIRAAVGMFRYVCSLQVLEESKHLAARRGSYKNQTFEANIKIGVLFPFEINQPATIPTMTMSTSANHLGHPDINITARLLCCVRSRSC